MPHDDPSWTEIRSQFALDPDYLHFGAFWLSSYPKAVRAAIDGFRASLDCNPVFYLADNEQLLDRNVRQALARHIGGDEGYIVLTGSSTEGLVVGVGMLKLDPGDEILMTIHEHYSAFSAVALLNRRTGAKIKSISLYNEAEFSSADDIVERIGSAITSNTRCLVLTWVHSCSGYRLPVNAISELITEINGDRTESERIIFCLDATHGFGIIPIDLAELNCDVFISSCHKWLNGPHGTGFVHLSKTATERIEPIIPSFAPTPLRHFIGSPPSVEPEPWEYLTPGGFHAFENRWSIAEAVSFANWIGQDRTYRHVRDLTTKLKGGLSEIPGVQVVTPFDADLSAGIICFKIAGKAPSNVVGDLRRHRVVASISPYKEPYARLTPSIYNSSDEVGLVLDLVKFIAK